MLGADAELQAMLADALARCEARAQAMRARGPLVLLLDALPDRTVDSTLRELSHLADRASGPDTHFKRRNTARGNSGKRRNTGAGDGYASTSGDYWDSLACVDSKSRAEMQAEIEAALVAQGVIVTSDPAYIALLDSMSCWDDAPGGARGVRLGAADVLDYDAGYILDDYGYLDYGAISLRHVSPEASDCHYYCIGHGLYRRAVALYGALDRRARRYERFSAPYLSGSPEVARACAGRSVGSVQHSAEGRAVLKQARAAGLALGSE